jgi:hypothetical protein
MVWIRGTITISGNKGEILVSKVIGTDVKQFSLNPEHFKEELRTALFKDPVRTAQ